MAATGLVASALAGTLASAMFFWVGHRLARRKLEGEAGFAWLLFRGWWFGIATYVAINGVALNLLAALDLADLRLFVAARNLSILLLCGALTGLTYHLLFLHFGTRRVLPWVMTFYAIVWAFIVYTFAVSLPVAVHVGAYEVRLVFDPAPAPGMFLAIVAALSLPQAAAALAHLRLFWTLEDRSQRHRALFVGGSLALWFVGAFTADLMGPGSPWVLVRPALGLLAAASVLLAYAPPAWLRERYGVRGLAESPG